MSEEAPVYKIRLNTGQWYQGRDEEGNPKWTRVPSWAHVFEGATPELAETLQWLEDSEHDYTLLEAR